MTLPSPPRPFQRPLINGPDVGVYSHRDIHAERGVTFWPVRPPEVPPLALAISGRALPTRWIIHYDNLVFDQGGWHYPGGIPATMHYGIAHEQGSTPRAVLAPFLQREIVIVTSSHQRHLATFAETTRVLAIQPVGVPYLRLLLPASLFLTRDAHGRQHIIPLPPTHAAS